MNLLKVGDKVREKGIVAVLKALNKHINDDSACEIGLDVLVNITFFEGKGAGHQANHMSLT